LLTKHKQTLQANDRGEQKHNTEVHKLAFLWDEYEPQYWWFEIYVCWQRMSLTGILVFIDPGSVIQVLVGLSFALGNIHMYVGERAKRSERVARTRTRNERRKRRVPFCASSRSDECHSTPCCFAPHALLVVRSAFRYRSYS